MNQNAIIRSTLWAAYGDALGFISEFVRDNKFLHKRLNGKSLETTVGWRRRVGGKFGIMTQLPAGCYSDDTQMRLSVSRAISGTGKFLIEAFASIELPIWRAYALGGGVGSRAAAENLTKPSNRWFGNFFNKGRADYFKSGGNGAAMRIQPHVWAAKSKQHPDTFLLDVICDSIITHGHPRGIFGAAFHALCLAYTFHTRSNPGPESWSSCVSMLDRIPELIGKNMELTDYWLPQWEKGHGKSIEKSIAEIKAEYTTYIDSFMTLKTDDRKAAYQEYAKLIGAQGGHEVGSGTKTTMLASVAAYLFQQMSPEEGLAIVANTLETDTDTIGTMAGALMGITAEKEPQAPVSDYDYLKTEAIRLASIEKGEQAQTFTYPSLMSWTAPKTLLDTVGTTTQGTVLAGLGPISLSNDSIETKDAKWVWATLPFGQTVFVKIRKELCLIPEGSWGKYQQMTPSHQPKVSNSNPHRNIERLKKNKQLYLLNDDKKNKADKATHSKSQHSGLLATTRPAEWNKVMALVGEASQVNFEPETLGRHLHWLSNVESGSILCSLYATIIADQIKPNSH